MTLLPPSDEFGLHLVLGAVEEGCPAHRCGLREGDIIVTVNGWLITVMDRPQVRRMDDDEFPSWTPSHLTKQTNFEAMRENKTIYFLFGQVAVHLFQAGANIVTLGILKVMHTHRDSLYKVALTGYKAGQSK